ncbi:tetratricopeptide repeat protein [Bacillaceae bacterium Marseille-Q3522]|nr:tetratricopeptide repeat protein [Bacillaceae bacterium Marseille-Q3522]
MGKIENIILLYQNGSYDKAAQQLRAVLHRGSDEEQFQLGEELFQSGFLEEAKLLFAKLLESYPQEGEIRILLAETHMELGEEEKAILELEKITSQSPEYVQALLLLADLYQMDGLYEVSERKLLLAKEELPDEPVILFALGELYHEEGKFLEAIRAYESVLKTDNEIAGVNVNERLADCLSAGGAFEEAIPYYEKALKRKIEPNTLFDYAFTALQAGFNQTAIEKFTQLREMDPGYHLLYLYLAKAYEKEEELENSFSMIQLGIKQDEYNKELYMFGGRIALKLGKEAQAEKLLRDSLSLDPEYIEAALLLNKLLLEQERYDDVLEVTGALEDEDEPQLLWDAAVAFQEKEAFTQALNKYQAAYTFFKDDEDFLNDYGYFLVEEGKRPEAVEIFSKLNKQNPVNEEYQEMLERLSEDY